MNYEHVGNGLYRIACPEPYWGGFLVNRARCQCGLKFKTREDYQKHWCESHDDTYGQLYRRTPDGPVPSVPKSASAEVGE